MNWALIGASTIASENMIGAIRAQSGAEIGWVVSGSAEHAASYAEAHDIPRWTVDLAEALADPQVQAVYISSTNEKHHGQALAAIAAGKHVLCEKPMALSRSEAEEMIVAARDAGVVLAVNHHLRSSAAIRAIRRLLDDGALGQLRSMRIFHAVALPRNLYGWRLDQPAAGGGVIADITVHNADTARFLLQEDPQFVVAEKAMTGLGQGVEDSAMSVWTMPSGVMVYSHESFTHPFARSGLEIHGSEGSLYARGVMQEGPDGAIELVTAQGSQPVSYDWRGAYDAVVADFMQAAAEGRAPAASGVDGLRSLMVAEAVRRAAMTGKRQAPEYGDLT